ncbi:MAG TPA: hypothetical protein VFN08_21575 [Gemmatimonadales bacterium]|jgi:HlyD family secretion protein|nr:hypothetical protein [Gemmatimonadales bacterium]
MATHVDREGDAPRGLLYWETIAAYELEAYRQAWSGVSMEQLNAEVVVSVFTVSGGKARRRTVEPGHGGSHETEVRSGLRAGDTVIVHPDTRLRDGVRVEPRGVPRAR